MVSNVSDIRILDPVVIERLRESLGPEADEVLNETVSMFFADSDTHLDAAREAVLHGDRTLLRQLAHRLKGSALQLGAERMVHVASTLESVSQSEASSEVAALVDSLMAVFIQTRAALRERGLTGE